MVIAGAERLVSWARAVQARAGAVLVREQGGVMGVEQAATIVKDRLKVTAREGSEAVIRAHECARFPQVLHALESGQVTARKADTLLRAGQGLTEQERAAAIEVLLPEAPSRTWKWLSDQLNALTVRLHGSTLEVRRAEERSNVWLEIAGPGMGLLSALLPAKDAARVYNAVQAGSDQLLRLPGQTRTRGQARAAALTSLITGRIIPHPIDEHTSDSSDDSRNSDTSHGRQDRLDHHDRRVPAGVDTTAGDPSSAADVGTTHADQVSRDTDTAQARLSVPVTAPGMLVEPSTDTDLVPVPHEDDGILSTAPRPIDNAPPAGEVGVVIRGIEVPATINVVVPATVLANPDDHTPGILDHLGPIPADLAREIAAEGLWRRLVTDPVTGILTDYGTTAYQPPAHLRDAVRHRDRTCTHDGCDRPATGCDLDHIDPYNHQQPQTPGQPPPTRADNLHALCRTHHNLKTLAGWEVQRDPATGTEHWTSPTGHTATYQPEPTDPQHRYQTINQIQLPGTTTPGTAEPGTAGTATATAGTAASGTTAPDTHLPENSAPESDVPKDDHPNHTPPTGNPDQLQSSGTRERQEEDPSSQDTHTPEQHDTTSQNSQHTNTTDDPNPRKPEGHPTGDRDRRQAGGTNDRNANRQQRQDTTSPGRQDLGDDNASPTKPEGSFRQPPIPVPQPIPRLTVARPPKNPATPASRTTPPATSRAISPTSNSDTDALPPF
ncbi:hypothetical protein [Myceligenerans crystallogenes]|uniref:HNH endonuclease signature motif containing protein n=1 Tax=Myceligenerans crystallogenes TaxID=316335 RepID=UPI0031CFD7E0